MHLKESPTKFVVGGLIGVALIAVAYTITGPLWGTLFTLLLLYEAWTLINDFPGDTISEIIWTLSKRPMVPWIFGVATGWAIGSRFIENVWLIGALLFLQGHFFFQKQDTEVEIKDLKEKVIDQKIEIVQQKVEIKKLEDEG